jgi:Uma2 family endonuclease
MPFPTLTREAPCEAPVRYVGHSPITFREYLRFAEGEHDIELLDGALVTKMVAFADHENLFSWLHSLLDVYVEKRGLGLVLGSRTAVEINNYRGRLPDILFLRTEHRDRLHQEAIYGAPDLVIEIASPNDRPGDLIALETDYRSIGVPEIVFILPKTRQVRIVHKRGDDYEETTLGEGTLVLEQIENLLIETRWLYAEPRPVLFDLLTDLFKNEGR